MKTIRINDFNNIIKLEELSVTIGAFDGIHLGHQELIKRCKESKLKSAVITFDPDPDSVFKKLDYYPVLMPIDKKEEIIESFGIDYFIIFEFNLEFSKLSKDKFIDILKALNVKEIVLGYDFRFGYKAEGSIKDLKIYFDVVEIEKILIDSIRVSSTYIKELLKDGNISLANSLLGRNYSIKGVTFIGSQKGMTIGFPTANINYKNYFLPKNGVYLVKVIFDNKEYYGMANIGHNPTFNFQNKLRLEVNIFGISGILYNKTMEVFFIKHIRDEIKFNNINELKNQLNCDKNKCLELIKNNLIIM